MTKRHKLIFLLIITACLAVYIITIDFNAIGHYNDDAWYINAARYIAGVQADQKQLSGRPIGYPVLLVPIAGLFPDSLLPFRLSSLFFIISMVIIPFVFFRDLFEPDDLLIFTALIGFNQFSVILSGDVISEAPYLFFSFIAILAMKKTLEDPGNISRLLFLSLFMAFLAYIRSQGVLFFAAVFIWFVSMKKIRELAYLAFFYMILILPLLVPGITAGSSIDKYAGEIGSVYGNSSALDIVFGNIAYYFKWGIYTGIAGIVKTDWNSFMFSVPLVIIVSSLLFFFMAAGFIRKDIPEYMKPVRIYVILYLLMHIFWINFTLRYLIPVFPFLLYFLMLGFLKPGRRFSRIACLLLMAFYIHTSVIIISEASRSGEGSPKRTLQTYEWIKQNIPEKAVCYSNFSERLFLMTGRRAHIMEPGTRDELYQKLLTGNIDYVVLFTSRFLQKTSGYSPQMIKHRRIGFYMNDISRYRQVYEDTDEKTGVWQVLKSTSFLPASKLAHQGMNCYSAGKPQEAAEALKKALEIHTDYPSVSVNLALLLIEKGDYSGAKDVIDRAITLYKNSPPLFSIRARLEEFQGKDKDARYDRLRADRLNEYLGNRNDPDNQDKQ
ncbi:MAG: tetratricopeptide repeat protein [Elusimicrobiota bacterium]